MRINQSLESDLPFGCISLTLLFFSFLSGKILVRDLLRLQLMTQFSHFFTAVRSLGQERDLRYRGAQKFRGPAGNTSTEPVNKDFEDNIALEAINKQTNKQNFFLFKSCKPREICWLCHAVILFAGIPKENMLDHKNKLSDNDAFDKKNFCQF